MNSYFELITCTRSFRSFRFYTSQTKGKHIWHHNLSNIVDDHTMKISITRTLITAIGLFTIVAISLFNTSHVRNNPNTDLENHFKDVRDVSTSANHSASMKSKFVYKVPSVDCVRLMSRDGTEVWKNWTTPTAGRASNLNIEEFINLSKSAPNYCEILKETRQFVTSPLTQEEADMPIAYSIMVYKDAELFERLLRSIYRPQNYFCVHVDLSSDIHLHDAIRVIAGCFENVFIPADLIDVEYAQFSSLQAEIVCMRELLKHPRWKYFINLTGQEFPLQTSIALVRILKALNGANSIEGTVIRNDRTRYRNAGPVPVNVTLTKGAVHIVGSRAYVDYVVNNETAKKFLDWVKETEEPDETYFSSLSHSPQLRVPGSYRGWPESFTIEYPFLARFKNWAWPGPSSYPCGGKYVRSICVFGVGDLPILARRPELFANKFNLDFEPAAYACMEELLCNRTLSELTGQSVFNASSYSQLFFVKNHI